MSSQIISEPNLKFQDNQLVSGVYPRYKFIASDNGTVNISASASGFTGGPCLNPLYNLYLYDNGALKAGPLAAANGTFSGNVATVPVATASIHDLELRFVTTCSASPLQSSANIANTSMSLSGPLGRYCPITKTVTSSSVTYNNNQLASGSLPSHSFTAANNERVNVRMSIGSYTGGPCLTPPFSVYLYDNGLPKFDAFNGTAGGWSRAFPEFTASVGSSHVLEMRIITHCTGGTFQSTANFPNDTMTINREYP